MASAWTFQVASQVEKHGADAASWYVGWIDPDGQRRAQTYGPGEKGKAAAERRRVILEDQLSSGRYEAPKSRARCKEFRERYEAQIVSGMGASTRRLTLEALNGFERLVSPARVASIKTDTVDQFIALRRVEKGRRKGDVISPATVNRQLRHLKAVLRIAAEWDYLPKVPKVRMLREPGKLVRFITPEHFAAIYQACDEARWPDELPNIAAADWWRGLLMFGYMTGWRISEILALRRADVDLEAGYAITWHEDNKGKRDEKVKLHPIVVEHLKRLPGFAAYFFQWSHGGRQLYDEFAALQKAAGVKLPCRKEHEHTAACHAYGFHDLRRAFATMNAKRLTADALQKLMRHKSYATTQRYINMASQLDEAVAALHVPEVKAAGARG